MSSAPKGSYSSWVLPDGRHLTCELMLVGHDLAPDKRAYVVRADGVFVGCVVRWRAKPVWRAALGGWLGDGKGNPGEWRTRGEAVDALLAFYALPL